MKITKLDAGCLFIAGILISHFGPPPDSWRNVGWTVLLLFGVVTALFLGKTWMARK